MFYRDREGEVDDGDPTMGVNYHLHVPNALCVRASLTGPFVKFKLAFCFRHVIHTCFDCRFIVAYPCQSFTRRTSYVGFWLDFQSTLWLKTFDSYHK